MNRNIVTVVNLIRTLDTESLRNAEVIANLVRIFGLMPWVNPGMNLVGPEVPFINQTGEAAIGQTPKQISKALVYLSKFKINSFCEIGICYGGNFLFCAEYLKRFNPEIQCLAVDPSNYLNLQIREMIDMSDWMRYVALTSDNLIGRKFDLVFIDGDHTLPWVTKDWENLGKHAKICAFHDIQEDLWPDSMTFWKEIKNTKRTTVEFLDCFSDRATHGIGIIHDKEGK
jgi:hypothetical protein